LPFDFGNYPFWQLQIAMATSPEQLRSRTKDFALRIIRLFKSLPTTGEAQVIGKQLLRSGTSVGANYRAACRSRSRAEFAAKIGIVVEEADESQYWMELLIDGGIIRPEKLAELQKEAAELTAIFTTSRQTAREK
jgi:four helix bundle protein